MTRVTAPINRLTRSLTAHPSVAWPSYLAASPSHAHNASGAALRTEPGEREDSNRRFAMTHRPTPQPVPSRNRTVPLMQTFNFRSTAGVAARLDASTIDYFVMPMDELRLDGAARPPPIRVPLLPDNFFPDRDNLAGHAPEAVDAPQPPPEISIVAAHPDKIVAASALTEIEGIGLDGIELKFAHEGAIEGAHGTASAKDAADSEPGMLRDLWKGLVDDVLGSATPPKAKS